PTRGLDSPPRIEEVIRGLLALFADARAALGSRVGFVYANATKDNVAEEVIRHALLAAAHHETSSTYDVDIARLLWQHGILSPDRLVINNGLNVPCYADNIMALRRQGYENVLPVLVGPEAVAV